MHKAAADPHLDLIALLNLDVDALLPELVDALGLAQEEDANVLLLGVRVEVVGESHINLIIALPDINGLILIELLVLVLQLLDLLDGLLLVEFEVLELLEELQLLCFGPVELLFELG